MKWHLRHRFSALHFDITNVPTLRKFGGFDKRLSSHVNDSYFYFNSVFGQSSSVSYLVAQCYDTFECAYNSRALRIRQTVACDPSLVSMRV